MTVKIVPNDKGNPPGKLADAELHFLSGPFEGLKLIGFAVWERKTGLPIYPAIVWQDTRTIERINELLDQGVFTNALASK